MAEMVSMPKLGFDMAEGTLVRWLKIEGEQVNKGEVLAEIETDKATVEVESGYSGIVYRLLVEQGTVVPVGTPIAVIAAPGEEVKDLPIAGALGELPQPVAEAAPMAKPEIEAGVEEPLPGEGGVVKASPLAKRIAREAKIDLHRIKGTGPGGRIVRRDIEQVMKGVKLTAAAETVTAAFPPMPAPYLPTSPAEDERLPVDRLRAAIGRRMADSKQQAPHFYITHGYDVDPLLRLRKEINDVLPEEDKISVNDYLVKAAALALRRFPNLNASLSGNEIIRHGAVNIGVAVAVESGLLMVVVRQADLKPLRAISLEIKEMAERARQGKVRPEDIEGSTFSISNLGMFDVEHFVAIINPPEAAILAIGSARQEPVVMDGEIQVRTRLRATLSADHRITDGAEAARFLQALAGYIEKPHLLLV